MGLSPAVSVVLEDAPPEIFEVALFDSDCLLIFPLPRIVCSVSARNGINLHHLQSKQGAKAWSDQHRAIFVQTRQSVALFPQRPPKNSPDVHSSASPTLARPGLNPFPDSLNPRHWGFTSVEKKLLHYRSSDTLRRRWDWRVEFEDVQKPESTGMNP